jgi:GTP-binding protein HflX
MASTVFIDADELKLTGDAAILCGVVFPEDEILPGEGPLDELALLADTLGVRVAGEVIQKLQIPSVRTFIGPGKAEEIAQMCRETGARIVIFNNDLKPQHQRNLSAVTGARVIDRTELILLIFAEHARSHQAKIAVDLARLEYQLPRLRHLWAHLERQRGGMGKLGGAGEQQMEVDRRLIRNRIGRLKEELAEIEKRRGVEVSKRHAEFQIALVGYTNAGKSTLMNALTNADVYVADRLFATLDTRTREWVFGDHRALLSDTVGFIRNLPHGLVASFHATLSEAIGADLLLHVVDCSHPAVERMVTSVEEVLKELGADGKRTILVLNKADLLKGGDAVLDRLRGRYPDWVLVSAKSGAGLTRLTEMVTKVAEEREVLLEMDVPAANGRLLAFLQRHGKVLEQVWGTAKDKRASSELKISNRHRAVKPGQQVEDEEDAGPDHEAEQVAHVRVLIEPRWLGQVEALKG